MSRTLPLLLLSLLAASPLAAEIGALDEVPAATLLLPYFEVDLDDPNGVTTVISVGNTRQTPVILHFALWTDLGVPTLTWNVFLTGYDLHRFDLRSLFDGGTLPATSHDNAVISPVGSFSLATNPLTGAGPDEASCNGMLPLPALPATLLNHIRTAHTGQASSIFGGLCSGIERADGIARGYLTMDHVSSCSLDSPGDSGYFLPGGTGVASNQNAVVGDFAYIDRSAGRAEGHALLHLEASSTAPTTQPGQYTFYARYSGGADNREALPTTYWVRYQTPLTATDGTSYLYWRDTKRTIAPFSCAIVAPLPFPLGSRQIAIFDEAEDLAVGETVPSSPGVPGVDLLPFPFAAGRVRVGGPDFPVPFPNGWLYLNLNSYVADSQVPHEPAMQGWIGPQFQGGGGQYQHGFDAFPIDNAANASDVILPTCDGPPDPPGCL